MTIEQMRQMVEIDEAIQSGKQASGGNLDLDSRKDLAREQRKHAVTAGAWRAVVVG
jgi:hypothetical protein